MTRGHLGWIVAGLAVMVAGFGSPPPAPAATHEAAQVASLKRQIVTLRKNLARERRSTKRAWNVIDDLDDRVSQLEATDRCTSWLAVDVFASPVLTENGSPLQVIGQALDGDHPTYWLPFQTDLDCGDPNP